MNIKIQDWKSDFQKSNKAQLTNLANGRFLETSHSSLITRRSSLQHGMITFLYIALLAIMMILVMVETSSLIRLRREVKLMEQQQIKRLNALPANPAQTTTNP